MSDDMSELWAYACIIVSWDGNAYFGKRGGTYHGLDVRVGNRVELLVLQLVVRPNVDVRAPVFRRVAVLGRREH